MGQIVRCQLFGFWFSMDTVVLPMVNWLALETQESWLPQALEWLISWAPRIQGRFSVSVVFIHPQSLKLFLSLSLVVTGPACIRFPDLSKLMPCW